MTCMVRATSWGAAIARPAPAVFMFMNAFTANVDGNSHENAFQNPGKLLSGHENPVRKRHIGDMKRKSTNTVSLWRMNELNVMLKTTQAET